MSTLQGTPQADTVNADSKAPQMETTIDERTGQVTQRTVDGQTRNVEVKGQSPFSPEMMEEHKELLDRYTGEDGSYNMDSILKTLAEQKKLISSGAHKEAPAEEAPKEQPNAANPPEAEPTGSTPTEDDAPEANPQGDNSEGSLSFAQLDAIMAETGELTQSQLDLYTGDKEVAIMALQAKADARAQDVTAKQNVVFDITGGEMQFKDLTKWAADNLTEAECNNFNEAYASNDTRRIELETHDLIRKRQAVDGSYGQHFAGASSAGHTDTGAVFANRAEYTAYQQANAQALQRDRSLQSALQAKLSRSIKAGTITS